MDFKRNYRTPNERKHPKKSYKFDRGTTATISEKIQELKSLVTVEEGNSEDS